MMIHSLLLISFLLTTCSSQGSPSTTTNRILSVDLLHGTNLERHQTTNYWLSGKNLVLRRGETLDFSIYFERSFNKTTDKVRLEFALGDNQAKYVPLLVEKQPNGSDWTTQILEIRGRHVRANLFIPADTPIGLWNLKISSKLALTRDVITYNLGTSVYIIFNAWNADDDVYISREDARQEYVLNERGKIYTSSHWGMDWTYGQFDFSVLPSIMHLLDRLKMSQADRASPVRVARAVSALVNSHNEGGLLVGDWSGKYRDGSHPSSWTNSVAIFRRFIEQGYRSVKFGQCWVFGGLTTTALRALGIPARTITNYQSAHDTDSSLTVDKFYSNGNEMKGVNGDSSWNFHVWSEAWMARRDLPPGFGGWQAIDATPQEQSNGVYQLGPASVEAVKQGRVDYAYDVGFVYSEVNSYTIHWHLDRSAKYGWRRTRVEDSNFGRYMLTKKIGSNQYENIVDNYKYPVGSAEYHRARNEAFKSAGLLPLFDDKRRRR